MRWISDCLKIGNWSGMSRIKIPEVGEWMWNLLYAMPNNRAEEFDAPPDVAGGAFLADRFQKKPNVSFYFVKLSE